MTEFEWRWNILIAKQNKNLSDSIVVYIVKLAWQICRWTVETYKADGGTLLDATTGTFWHNSQKQKPSLDITSEGKLRL